MSVEWTDLVIGISGRKKGEIADTVQLLYTFIYIQLEIMIDSMARWDVPL